MEILEIYLYICSRRIFGFVYQKLYSYAYAFSSNSISKLLSWKIILNVHNILTLRMPITVLFIITKNCKHYNENLVTWYRYTNETLYNY